MSFRRRLMMAQRSGGLPYDAEVEYLGSNGTPYIDSGIECTGDLSVEFEGRMFSNVNRGCLGAIKDLGSSVFRHHWSPFTSYSPFYWIQNDNSNRASIQQSFSTDWFVVSIDADNGIALVNGVQKTFTPVGGSVSADVNYGIFARLGLFQSRQSAFKYVKLKKGGVLLRDYIPVRVGTTGYLYDKVSGTLFGNANSSGAFTFGNDKN